MDFEYSPHRSAGGTMHMLSPTHSTYGVDAFPSIQQLRRSLSRSPSKPSRFHLHNMKSPKQSPTSPLSPSSLSRSFSIDATAALDSTPNPRPKFTLRKSNTPKSLPRRTSPTNSTRRALADGTSKSNAAHISLPFRGSTLGQENRRTPVVDANKHMRFELDNEPIKFDLLKAHADKPGSLGMAMREHMAPAKSSPLKRSDGLMNLDSPNVGSPRAKRRSLHGGMLGSDFNVWDQNFDASGHGSALERRSSHDDTTNSMTVATASPSHHSQRSPQRRPFSLRRSTLQQRASAGTTKPKATPENDVVGSPRPGASASTTTSRARFRMSLDGSLPLRSLEQVSFFPPSQGHKPASDGPKPHPLSNALSPSSSSSSITDETTLQDALAAALEPVPTRPGFSRSLPIGALRPKLDQDDESGDSFETPDTFRTARPLPAAFMSTGLISKRNRNVDLPHSFFGSSTNMPDTPSKKASVPDLDATPAHPPCLHKVTQPRHEFGSPTTPFSPHALKGSPESFGKGVSIFGSPSFLSIDGDDVSNSPTAKGDRQSSMDELPPTPTKPAHTGPRPQSKGKGNSLRSSLLEAAAQSIATPPSNNSRTLFEEPLTPQESFTPPDASRLSINNDSHRPSSFNASVNGLPPATPTGPRDHPFNFSVSTNGASSSMLQNDVDTTLTSRFSSVHVYGVGEFSIVYRVENPIRDGPAASFGSSNNLGKVWVVKKSKKPYAGSKDRARKMKEVQILRALSGSEHIIELVDTWEMKNHLYIQTEFCENGNLKDFLSQTGYKARLDDFRIWKILLELTQGIKCIHDAGYIHLDLKPANVFIDWEGVLKIGDFGMASVWPAPPHLEGEGDREYIAPEVLLGRFDKPADIFALGMIMLEIAGNIVLPDNGMSWQRLRAGDMSDLPSLTFSSDSTLVRDESGDPVSMMGGSSNATLCASDVVMDDDDDLGFCNRRMVATPRARDLVQPPNFMMDSADGQSLERVVQLLISPNPDERPVIDDVLASHGVQWTAGRRRAGATIYEGNWGPADDVLNHGRDVEMLEF
ncbi:hypothetical protein ANO11243_046420 [Dothideomycetidae sp. 11243]|nr:hypothetical protein ANO11243_046420 [fungal sp. No.11243]